jgi:hypothetical protein
VKVNVSLAERRTIAVPEVVKPEVSYLGRFSTFLKAR